MLHSRNVLAEGGGGSQMGILYGLSVPDAENTNPHHMYGVKGSAFLAPVFSVGGYYLISGKTEGGGGDKFDWSLHGLEASYHIPSGSGDTFVAFRAGLSKIRTQKNSVDVIFSPYHYGIASGYDYYLTSWLSLGFEGSYYHVQKSRTDLNSVRYDNDSFNIMSFMVSLLLRL